MTPAYVYRHRVTFDETNLVGNVYFAHYLHWQGHCREHFLADHAPGVVAALADGLVLVTVACDLQFHAECLALDQIEVHMRLSELGDHRAVMTFDFLRLGGADSELVAQGRQTVAAMRRARDGLRPTPFPAELAAALRRYAAPTDLRVRP